MKSKTKFYLMAVAGASALTYGVYNLLKKAKETYYEALEELEADIQERGEIIEIESPSEKFKYYYMKTSDIDLEVKLKELASVDDVAELMITTQDGSSLRGDEWFKYYYKGAI